MAIAGDENQLLPRVVVLLPSKSLGILYGSGPYLMAIPQIHGFTQPAEGHQGRLLGICRGIYLPSYPSSASPGHKPL